MLEDFLSVRFSCQRFATSTVASTKPLLLKHDFLVQANLVRKGFRAIGMEDTARDRSCRHLHKSPGAPGLKSLKRSPNPNCSGFDYTIHSYNLFCANFVCWKMIHQVLFCVIGKG